MLSVEAVVNYKDQYPSNDIENASHFDFALLTSGPG